MPRKCPESGKTIFNEKWVATNFMKRRKDESGIDLRAYNCEWCGGYHITKIVKLVNKSIILKHAKEFRKFL